jgi:chromosome segregation ATPase
MPDQTPTPAEIDRLREENATLRQRLTSDVAGLSPEYGEEMSRLRRELADARAMLQGKDDAIAELEGELRKAKDNYGKLFAAKHVTIEVPAEPQEVLLLRMAETSKLWAMDYHRERQLRIDQANQHERALWELRDKLEGKLARLMEERDHANGLLLAAREERDALRAALEVMVKLWREHHGCATCPDASGCDGYGRKEQCWVDIREWAVNRAKWDALAQAGAKKEEVTR